MKHVADLFERILDRDNLRAAVHRALRGKRDRAGVRSFTSDLDAELAGLAREVCAGTFPLGRVHQFVIHDPKEPREVRAGTPPSSSGPTAWCSSPTSACPGCRRSSRNCHHESHE
jgi:hypothetical protein